jgi:hypothetical protein
MSEEKRKQIACMTHNNDQYIGTGAVGAAGSQMAIFEKKDIWKPRSKGTVHLTFGKYKADECSTNRSWAYKGPTKLIPSMNLGFIDPPIEDFTFNDIVYKHDTFKNAYRNGYPDPLWTAGATIIHEFCHVLGMDHEHQNNLFNSNKLNFNVPNIVKTYKNNYEEARTNVLELYSSKKKFIGSEFDPDSIMLYYFDDDWIIGPNPTKPNYSLSQNDINWLSKMYPRTRDITLWPEINVCFIDPIESDQSIKTESEPEWKRAWVMKVVTENLFPHIGIKANFKLKNKILYVYCSEPILELTDYTS